MDRAQKTEVIHWLKDRLTDRPAVVFTNFQGLTVEQMTRLRDACRQQDIEFRVVKNTLLRKAAAGSPWINEVEPIFHGNTAVAFPKTDAVAAAKVLAEFASKQEKLVIKGGVLAQKFIGAKQVDALSKLPSREALITKVAVMLNQPMTRLVTALSATSRKLAIVVKALEEKKKVEGNA